jgi:serine phosphatase RsbU (regulator of sigma subunit)
MPPLGRLLLVEDDDGDALLVEELLAEGGEQFELERVTTLQGARERGRLAECLLLDLGLPDSHGLDGLRKLKEWVPEDVSIIVLTGLADRPMGIAALELGAQDYLVKGEVDGQGLARAVRYAIERSRADAASRRLRNAQRRAVENERLARGLLPSVDVGPAGLGATTSYRPGGRDALLGGDFLDAVVTANGTVRAVIGDVCGHGPDEAAIGVALRFTWRALASEGIPAPRVLNAVEQALLDQTSGSGLFVTVCDIEIDPKRRLLTVRRSGHPAPLLVQPEVRWLDEAPPSPPLGVVPGTFPAPTTIELGPGWELLLLTDGLYEGRHDDDRLGIDGLATLVQKLGAGPDIADRLIGAVTDLNGGPLEDDVAVLVLADRHPA